MYRGQLEHVNLQQRIHLRQEKLGRAPETLYVS